MNKKAIAMIDPVGGKAGMDFYDSQLLKNIALGGYETFLFSNVVIPTKGIQSYSSFNNMGVQKLLAIFNNFVYFIKALVFCKRRRVSWLFLHLFRGGIFDLITMGISRLMGFRIILIIHDVSSLDTIALPVTRKIILTWFSHTKVVHNRFSYKELELLIGNKFMGNVKIIPHGNFTELENMEPSGLKSITGFKPVAGERYLLFFGQLKKSKGLDVLLKAIVLSESRFKLVIAGRTRDVFYSDYSELLNNETLKDRVTILDRFITNEERDFLLRSCEIVVIPYLRIYQSGVMLMAMSYKKAVIVSDLEPNLELIVHNKNGLLFKSGDARQLGDLLQELFNGKYDIKLLGEQGNETVKKHNNWLTISKMYINILET